MGAEASFLDTCQITSRSDKFSLYLFFFPQVSCFISGTTLICAFVGAIVWKFQMCTRFTALSLFKFCLDLFSEGLLFESQPDYRLS